MSFPKQIFKAYDIRGIYPKELDEDIAYRVGQAYAELIKAEVKKEEITVVIGHDMRNSSPSLKKEVVRGVIDQGVNVVEIGLASTPTFYFAVAKYGYDGGLQVSASHNPGEYNGFKITRARAVPISGTSGIKEIAEMVEKNEFVASVKKGQVQERDDILSEQIKIALTYVDISKIKPLKIVVDTANAMGAPLIEELFKYLPCELVKMYFELDGSFPNHEADPFKDENNLDLQKKVLEVGADLGIALDGDADRLFIIDNKGKTIEPAMLRGILSKVFLRQYPGAKICYDIRPGRITIDMIEQAGGVPVITSVGHSLVKEKAQEVGAVFAGESSGHFYLKMPYGFFDATDIMILKLLQEFSESGQSVSEFTAPLYRYFHSGEINFEVDDKQAVSDRLQEKYGDHLKYNFDGLSFEFDDFWFNVRASNTENKVRLNLEAVSQQVMEEKTKEVSGVIQ
ncbi:MAG: phosphomannomutase/phosphoglucomutase [bacterium]